MNRGAWHIKFAEGYGQSGFPFLHLLLEVDRQKKASNPEHFWIAASQRGKATLHWSATPPADGGVFGRGVCRPDFTGKPLPETLAYVKANGVPCLEYSDDGSARVYYPQTYMMFEPYVGRLYEIFKSDCYSLVREYLEKSKKCPALPLGELKEAYRRSQEMGRDFLAEAFKEYGYEQVAKPMPGDVVVMGAPGTPTHVGILIEDNQLLHHYPGRLSCIEPYDGHWIEETTMIMRYRGEL